MKGCGIMDFYAAAVREPGRDVVNSDGVMIKGYAGKGESLFIMVLCHGHRDNKYEAARSDRVIRRIARWLDKRQRNAEEIEKYCRRLLMRRWYMRGFEITAFIFCGRRFCIMGNVSGKITRISGTGISQLNRYETGEHNHDDNCDEPDLDGIYVLRGDISSGSTFLLSTDNFRTNLSEKEVHDSFCPQICKDDETMQYMMEELVERLRDRKETDPVSAAALCVK